MTTGAPAADAEGRGPGTADEPGGFAGRGGWQLIAFLAALALILALSIDWYTTEQGEEFRRVEQNAGEQRQVQPDLDERAAQAAEGEEKTAWQADAFLDRLILLACLVAFVGAVVAAFMRSAGRRPKPPWHPSAIATVAGVAGTLLILYRMFQPPGLNEAAVIKSGAPIGLVAVGVLTIGSRLAVLGERDELAGETAAVRDAPAAPHEVGPVEAEPVGQKPKPTSRWRLRRRRGAEAAPVAGADEPEPAAAGEPTPFEFDFPSPPPPVAEHREEMPAAEPEPPPVQQPPDEPEPGASPLAEEEREPLAEPEPAHEPAALAEPDPLGPDEAPSGSLWHQPEPEEAADEAPPVDQRPVGAENPEEGPPWQEPDALAATDPLKGEPLEDEPVEGEPVEDEPVEGDPFDADLADEPVHGDLDDELDGDSGGAPIEVIVVDESIDELPVEEPPVDELADDEPPVEERPGGPPPVEPSPVEEPPVEAPPVESPPVEGPGEPPPLEAPEESLPLGEEIEFERDPDDPAPPDPEGPAPPDDARSGS